MQDQRILNPHMNLCHFTIRFSIGNYDEIVIFIFYIPSILNNF